MTDKYANLRARLAALKLGGPVSTDPGKWNAATDALDVELVAELLAERDAMVQAQPAAKCDGNHGGPQCADPECWNDDPHAQPAAVSDAEIDDIIDRAGSVVGMHHGAWDTVNPRELVRAILALRPQATTFCKFCGGNDEDPQDHCMDCARPQAVPMTAEQVRAIMTEAGYDGAKAQARADFISGIRHAEQHYRIGITAQAKEGGAA